MRKERHGKVKSVVWQILDTEGDISIGELKARLSQFSPKSVQGAYYKWKKHGRKRSAQTARSQPISPVEHLIGKLPGVDIRLGDVPQDIGIINGKPLGTLRVSKDGIAFRKHKKKATDRIVKWDALAALGEIFG